VAGAPIAGLRPRSRFTAYAVKRTTGSGIRLDRHRQAVK